VSNTRLAPQLQGNVLLIYGGIDENMWLKHAFVTLNAFIKADKDVDTLIVPDSSHGAPEEPYAVRRSVQYFLDHLAARPASP
jgi:dipeptidyl aminopeptidase/acylaminoacyl peptidase